MKKRFNSIWSTKSILKKVIFVSILLSAGMLHAQSPVAKVDLNMSGRTEAECNDPNYLPWIPDNAVSTSKTINGVTFTFKKVGSNGSALKADWYKVGVQNPNYARLTCDGLTVQDGDAGAQIELTITGLATGTHSFMAFHNAMQDPSNSFAPIDVVVNGTQTVTGLAPSKRALDYKTVQSSYVTFSATAGKSTVILYKAQTNNSASLKNVVINGFELNTPNVKEQATDPVPDDGDLHVNADNGTFTLGWTAAASAAKHRVYFSTNQNDVVNGMASALKAEQTTTTYKVSGLYNLDTYYWRVDEVTAAGVVTKGNVWVFKPRHDAFPGAEGYGRYAIGGRGGKVVHVTNLKDDSNPGSLRYAVEVEKGPRTIVFDVGGVIVSTGRMVQSDPFVTIAGQTAPGEGICIRKAPFGSTGNDGITRFMRVQIGYGITFDGMGLTGSDNSILDHCSINFAIDEQFSSRGGKNVTLQKTLIGEALNDANHSNYPAGTQHAYAGTISGKTGSYHHNLLVHNKGRNWSMGDAIDGSGVWASKLDLFNNIVYNYGGRATDGEVHQVQFVNNYYKKGPATTINYVMSLDIKGYGTGTEQCYFSGNIIANQSSGFTCDGTNNSCGRQINLESGFPMPTYNIWPSTPFFSSLATVHSAKDAFKVVLSDVGNNQPFTSDRDIRLVNETKTGTTKYKGSVTGIVGLIDRETDAGGYDNFATTSRPSNFDTDNDGLPNWWETYYGSNPNSAKNDFSDANADADRDGYTELEEYLDWLANPHYTIAFNATQSLTLADLFRGFSSPTYAISKVTGGTCTITNGVAKFTPSSCGMGYVTIKATESGFSWERTVGIFTEAGSGSCVAVLPKPPVVSITAPVTNATFNAPASVTLTATATDEDGTISKVEFFNGTTLLGTATTSPYTYTWSNVAAGTYSITAKATDNGGNTTTSTVVTIVVNAVPTDCNGTPNGTATLDNCSRCVGGTSTKTACVSSSEIETDACNYDGVLESSNAGFKGTGYINVPNAIGSQITFSVNATTAGTYTLSFRYASGGTADRNANVLVNGVSQNAAFAFPATGSFTTYGTIDITLNLNAGTNTVQLVANTADGLANIDQVGYVSEGVSKGGCVVTGLEAIANDQLISIYPNPSRTNFYLKASQSSNVLVLDVDGKVLEKAVNVADFEFGSDLRPGVYMLKIENRIYKIVKE